MILVINYLGFYSTSLGIPIRRNIIVFLGLFWGPPSYGNYQTVAKVYLAESSVDLSDQRTPYMSYGLNSLGDYRGLLQGLFGGDTRSLDYSSRLFLQCGVQPASSRMLDSRALKKRW